MIIAKTALPIPIKAYSLSPATCPDCMGTGKATLIEHFPWVVFENSTPCDTCKGEALGIDPFGQSSIYQEYLDVLGNKLKPTPPSPVLHRLYLPKAA